MIQANQVRPGPLPGLLRGVLEGLIVAAVALAPALATQAADTEEPAAAEAASAEAASDAMPCPALTAEKYPFVTCVRGPSGGPVLATEGPGVPGARLDLERWSAYADGPGGWGDSGIE